MVQQKYLKHQEFLPPSSKKIAGTLISIATTLHKEEALFWGVGRKAGRLFRGRVYSRLGTHTRKCGIRNNYLRFRSVFIVLLPSSTGTDKTMVATMHSWIRTIKYRIFILIAKIKENCQVRLNHEHEFFFFYLCNFCK